MQNVKENWLLAWKMTKEIWLVFMRAVESLKICTLIGSFCQNHVKLLMKKYRKVTSHDTEEWCKVWRKTDFWFQKRHEELVNCNGSSRKSENLQFDVLLLPIAYKVSAKKVRKSYLSWHWKVIQTLQENWLFVWKMTSGIWRILTRAVESLKVCTLMGYCCQKYVMFELNKYRRSVSWKMTNGFKNDKEFGEFSHK